MSSSSLRHPIRRRRVDEKGERRVPPPVKITPAGEASSDSVEKLFSMLEASTVVSECQELVLFGAGLYDESGKPRVSQCAAMAAVKSRKRRVRKAAQKRADGFTRRGTLADLAGLTGLAESAG
jgi:hypothetical protein